MKYYVYISDAKLEMLYPQIPRKLLERFAGELEVNISPVKGSIKINNEGKNKFIYLDRH